MVLWGLWEMTSWPSDLPHGKSPAPLERAQLPSTSTCRQGRRLRGADNDDMEVDAQDKPSRPRSPTVSYHTDAYSNVMEDGTLDGLDEFDRKILSAAILGVDVTEVYSPERVVRVAKRFGLTTGSSMDLTTGWGFNREDHKLQARSKI